MRANLLSLVASLTFAISSSLGSAPALAQASVPEPNSESTSIENVQGKQAAELTPEDQAKLDQLVQLNPTTDKQTMLQQVEEYAAQQGQTIQQCLETSLTQANQSSQAPAEMSGPGKSSAVGERFLTNARTGTIFVTSAWLGPINHGHVGIYDTGSTVVEATGLDSKFKFHNSRRELAKKVKVYRGAVLQNVGTSKRNKLKAARKARKHYVNRPYNVLGFAFNKKETHELNCSQLVWLAYQTTSRLDLDGNGGPGVYPWDIYNSSRTKTYQTLN